MAANNVVELKSRRGERALPLAAVCLAAVVSLGLLLVNFQLGVICLAGSVGLALVFRAILPDRRAGLLVVRGRVFDLSVLATLTTALVMLAVVVPPPH